MSFSEIKINLHYGGLMKYENKTVNYIGGSLKQGIVFDPDYMTWSMFDSFCEDNGIPGLVEHAWYKLPHQDMSSVQTILELNSDANINEMCAAAIRVGEVDIFLENKQASDNGENEKGEVQREEGLDAEREEVRVTEREEGHDIEREEAHGGESDSESDGVGDGDRVEAEEEVVEEVVAEGDTRFTSFFEEICNQEAVGLGDVHDNLREVDDEGRDRHPNVTDHDDAELEWQCRDPKHPTPAEDTDDEWEDFNRKEREISRTKYSNEEPPYLWLLQKFNSGEEFKDQVLRYVLKTNFDVKLCRWEKHKLAAICTKEDCKWKIYYSVEKRIGKWMVKTYVDNHNHMKSSKARMLKQRTIACLFKDEARRRPGIKWTDIKDEIMMRYNLSVSKWICRKARRLALDMVIETQKEHFAKLWDYEKELRRSNANVSTEIVTIPRHDGKQVFDRFYISFDVLKKSWKRCCRPIIGLDGAFMKWELKGEILAVVGRDADNRIFPFAWAIVRVEDNDSWAWFVGKLKKELDLGLGNGLTIISDKQKGLINVVADLLPNSEHRHYARHIFSNWKKVYGMCEYEDYFWAVAYSSFQGDYEYNMKALKKFDPVVHDDLLRTEPKTWCGAFFSINARCEDVTNNLSESFNKTIKEARKLPLINMLEEIRRLAMKRIASRCVETGKCDTKFPPHIMEIFEENRTKSEACKIIRSSESLYEVVAVDGSYEVCLPDKHCACNRWNITGIPCPHVISIISELNRDPEDYVDDYYLTSTWQDTYANNIKPVNGERLWEKTGKDPIEVPEKRRMAGRPKKFDRIKEPQESQSNPTKATREGRTITCSNCKQTGHNMSTCTRAHVEAPPKQKRGTPRKNTDDDPWSIQNAPKRKKNAQSQNASSAPPASTSSAPPASTSRGRGRGCGRGRGRGREPPIPRGYGCYISPYTGRVFEVWGSRATDLDVSNTKPTS